jgi:streptogramin lyase
MQGIRRLTYLMTMTAGILAVATSHVAAASAEPARAGGVSEYQVEAKRIGGLAQASEGTVIYGSTAGSWDHREPRLGRVGPQGPFGETAGPRLWNGELAIGTEGDLWAATIDDSGESWISRSMSGGAWSQIAGTAGARAIAPRASGGVWFLQMEPRGIFTINDVPKVGYVSTAGEVVAFPLSDHEAGLSSIVEGHEGDAWFTEYFADKIGHMTPTGQLTEFSLRAGSRPAGITVDAHGNFWFTEPGENRAGQITPTGKITEYSLPQPVRPAQIAAGADGRLWFTEGVSMSETARIGNLGRITPSGQFTQFGLPDSESELQDVIAGAEGNIWYSAMGEHGCVGGGSCLMWEPKNPAIVGRIKPAPLTTAVAAGRAALRRIRIDVAISCSNGNVTETCKGSIAIKLNGKQVAKSRYSVPIDTSRKVPVRRIAGVSSLVKATLGKRRALAIVRPDASKVRRRAITLIHPK